jgi:hypothetical protein
MGFISLREIPGVEPASKHYPQAEYEMTIYSVNPEEMPNPDPDRPPFPHLLPLDVVEQFHGVTEAQVERLAVWCVRAVVDGVLSPDQDFRSEWRRTIQVTVQHLREGCH